ncbi:MAG: hypothetical protein WCO69_00025 [Candidatus Omnitrophota bacterium]
MLHNKKAQVSLMFMVAIALALVFMAMVMNWNRSVVVKTQAQVAATQVTAELVSRMASYAEKQMAEYLDGKIEKCDENGVLGIIIMIVLIIVIIVLCIFTCGAAGVAMSAVMVGIGTAAVSLATIVIALTIALVLTVATLALQMAYIQPQITAMWNKEQQNITTSEDAFLEASIQTAIRAIQTDTEQIPDLLDYNQNGKYNVPGLAGSDRKELVSRFVYHNTARLGNINTNSIAFTLLYNEMKDFLMDLGMDTKTMADCSVYPGGNSDCYYRGNKKLYFENDRITKAGSDCLTKPLSTPYLQYPYNFDALRCVSPIVLSDGKLTTDGATPWATDKDTVAVLLGKERVMLRDLDAAQDNAAPEQGYLFPFLWKLKDAVDANLGGATKDIFTGNRAKLGYFYNPSAGLTATCATLSSTALSDDDTLAAVPTTQNRWRPGDNRFCMRNVKLNPDNSLYYFAAHNTRCDFDWLPVDKPICQDPSQAAATYEAGIGSLCNCDALTAAGQGQWLNDQFDANVGYLRDFWQVFSKFTGWSAQILFKANPVQYGKLLWNPGAASNESVLPSLQVLKSSLTTIDGMLYNSDATLDFNAPSLAGDGQADLLAAAVPAKAFVTHFPHAMLAFDCSRALVPADCMMGSKKMVGIFPGAKEGDRLAYLAKLTYDATQETESAAISPYVIYGWQSANVGKQRGYRHLVKVELATPKRCRWWINERGGDNSKACYAKQFPWIKTEKRGETTRCYELADGVGCVKTRITRWDEDRLSKTLSFLNNLELWTILSGHPAYDNRPTKPKDLEACFNRDKVVVGGLTYYIPNSFMVNKDEDYTNRYGMDCADAVASAVRRGFVTEVCAKYYAYQPDSSMRMKFINCKDACPVETGDYYKN